MTLLAIFEALVGANAIWETTVAMADEVIITLKRLYFAANLTRIFESTFQCPK